MPGSDQSTSSALAADPRFSDPALQRLIQQLIIAPRNQQQGTGEVSSTPMQASQEEAQEPETPNEIAAAIALDEARLHQR